MLDQGPMPPGALPPLMGGPPPMPQGFGAPPVDPSMMPPMMAPPPVDPGADALAGVIADAIRSYQSGQAADAMQHPVVQALLAPAPDAGPAYAGGSFGATPPPGFVGG